MGVGQSGSAALISLRSWLPGGRGGEGTGNWSKRAAGNCEGELGGWVGGGWVEGGRSFDRSVVTLIGRASVTTPSTPSDFLLSVFSLYSHFAMCEYENIYFSSSRGDTQTPC